MYPSPDDQAGKWFLFSLIFIKISLQFQILSLICILRISHDCKVHWNPTGLTVCTHYTVTSSDFLTLSRIWVQTLKYRFAFLFRKFRATSKRWTSGDELHALDWKSGVQILDLRRSSDSEWWIAIAGVIFEWCRMKRPAIDELSTRRELSTREAKRI